MMIVRIQRVIAGEARWEEFFYATAPAIRGEWFVFDTRENVGTPEARTVTIRVRVSEVLAWTTTDEGLGA